MSSSKARRGRAGRRLAVLALLALGACGFQPVYAPGGGELAQELATVRVEQPEDRTEQHVRNAVLDALGTSDRPARTEYLLRLRVNRATEGLALQEDETAARVNVTVTGRWELATPDGRTVMEQGSVRRTVAYEVVDDDFASLMAERNAIEQAAMAVGQAIRTRLILALRRT